MKYRKKPVVIEAIQWTGNNLVEITEFIEQKPLDLTNSITSQKWDDYCFNVDRNGLTIHTLEGEMKASKGDFIIRGVSGEVYPCKPDIFEKTYEGVSRMTSKEKAIEALQKIESFHAYDGQFDDELKLVFEELKKPTIDDAIKVVESMKKSLPTLTSREEINVYKRVLTALKGLKGGIGR